MNIFHAQYIIKDDCHFMINILIKFRQRTYRTGGTKTLKASTGKVPFGDSIFLNNANSLSDVT
jgi:hypothetical protein